MLVFARDRVHYADLRDLFDILPSWKHNSAQPGSRVHTKYGLSQWSLRLLTQSDSSINNTLHTTLQTKIEGADENSQGRHSKLICTLCECVVPALAFLLLRIPASATTLSKTAIQKTRRDYDSNRHSV